MGVHDEVTSVKTATLMDELISSVRHVYHSFHIAILSSINDKCCKCVKLFQALDAVTFSECLIHDIESYMLPNLQYQSSRWNLIV